jgi:ketosteroid isomerase-like protein
MKRVIVVVLLLSSFALAQSAATAKKKPAGASGAAEAIRQMDTEWAKIAARRDIDAFMSHVADDARFVSAGELEIGKDAIHKEWEGLFKDMDTTVTWSPEFADASGDLGYSIGTYEFSGKGPNGPWTVKGRYQTTWRRGHDGQWRAVADIGSPAPKEKK